MDETTGKYAYRCLPLSMANQTGWNLYATEDFVVNYNGGQHQRDLSINFEEGAKEFVTSTFGAGIFTIHTGLLFRTEPEWDMLVTGPINEPNPLATALTGVVETHWCDFTFTMNYKMNSPGWFRWDKRIPLCQIIPIPHDYSNIETEFEHISVDPDQEKRYKQWADSRNQIVREVRDLYDKGEDGEIVKSGQPKTEWEKNYYSGKRKTGERIANHNIKRTFPKFGDIDDDV